VGFPPSPISINHPSKRAQSSTSISATKRSGISSAAIRDWDVEAGWLNTPAAAITTDMDSAWRQLTGAYTPPGAVTTSGPAQLAQPLLDVRSIIV
jgi:hypothetical protein